MKVPLARLDLRSMTRSRRPPGPLLNERAMTRRSEVESEVERSQASTPAFHMRPPRGAWLIVEFSPSASLPALSFKRPVNAEESPAKTRVPLPSLVRVEAVESELRRLPAPRVKDWLDSISSGWGPPPKMERSSGARTGEAGVVVMDAERPA